MIDGQQHVICHKLGKVGYDEYEAIIVVCFCMTIERLRSLPIRRKISLGFSICLPVSSFYLNGD